MKNIMTYSVKIKEFNHLFDDTVKLYRKAVDFYISVIDTEWELFSQVTSQKTAVNLSELYTVSTKLHLNVPYDFGKDFYKFPSYLRRAAIAEAYGKVCSYHSILSNWEKADPRTRGEKPSCPKAGYVCPAMYRTGCYIRNDDYTASLKVFIRNTWDWVKVSFRKSDVDYINHKCSEYKECVPTLRKRGRRWSLDFSFEYHCKLKDIPVKDQKIIAVDLGINSSCTCVCMHSDGTVIGRKFLKLPKEYDFLMHKIGRIKYAQRHGSRDVSNLWKLADGINDDIAVKTADFIMDMAKSYEADVIVFEHLDLDGKKKGSKKQYLHLWKARYVQSMVEGKAHRKGIRISRINAWGTSALAYDGSGKVRRGRDSDKANGCYSVCEFTTGKIYNCDLNAAYNIGSRYFVREIIKSLPVTVGQRIAAKVPGCVNRTSCTLSTLINLNTELHAAA